MKKTTYFILMLGLMLPAIPLNATAVTRIAADQIHSVGPTNLVVKAGSAYESLTVDDDTLTVTVPSGEAVELRSAGGYAAVLENDAGLRSCNVMRSGINQLVISGPRTVTVRPSSYSCDTSAKDSNSTPLLSMIDLDSVSSGDKVYLFWTTDGQSPAGIRLRLSLDDGATIDRVIADSLINYGYFEWVVPEVTTASSARILVQGLDGDQVVAVAYSAPFSIQGLPPQEQESDEEEEVSPPYSPNAATAAAINISADKNLPVAQNPICVPNSRIKTANSHSVYYCGTDSKRYVFPNQKTHDTWYSDFAGVIVISEDHMAQIPIGGNVTYRPGVRMVKIQSDPSVFAVDANGTLRWIRDEAMAARLYGPNWNRMIDDVPDSFFVNYTVGKPVE